MVKRKLVKMPAGTDFMALALQQAEAAGARGEVPIGAVIVVDGAVVSADGNRTREFNDPTAHAEVLAIRTACQILSAERLTGAHLYVTLEPCTMCAAAISFARIERLYYGAGDPKGGGVDNGGRFFDQPTCHFRPDVYSGFSETRAASLLRDFFKARR